MTSPTVYQPAPVSTLHMAIALIVAICTGGYMAPWAVAAVRGRPNTVSIGVITFLLGWTIIGWVWMLLKACSSEP